MPWNWVDGDFASSRRMNMGSTQKMTGPEIGAIVSADMEPGVLIYCTETGSGYTANNLYQRNEDNTAFDQVGLKPHSHIDAESGGSLADANIANIETVYSNDKRWARANAWWQTITSTGTIADVPAGGYIALNTGTTSGGSATISDGGGNRPIFSQQLAFMAIVSTTLTTNFTVKLGVAAEDINAGNLTPAKFGIEGCSTSGANWLVFSSDGTTRSTLATSAPVSAFRKYVLVCTPGTSIEFYVDSVLTATKTTNVPSTGTTGFMDQFRAGIKNSAAENKELRVYSVVTEGSIL